MNHKTTLFYLLTVGMVTYGFLGWKYSFLELDRSLVDISNVLKVTNQILTNTKQKEKLLNKTHETLKLGKINSTSFKLDTTYSTKQESKLFKTTQNIFNKRLDQTIFSLSERQKEFDVRKTVSILSKLTKIDEKSRFMRSVYSVLLRRPRPPSLSSKILKESEESLYSTVIPPTVRVTYRDMWHGFNLPVITCIPKGRLGNLFGQYATLYAINRLYNTSVVMTDVMKARLSDFQNLSLPKLPVIFRAEEWKKLSIYETKYNYSPMELAAGGLFGPLKFIISEYPFEIQLFHTFKKELKREFAFSPSVISEVQIFLKSVAEERLKNDYHYPMFIGFHVRRTDYIEYIESFHSKLPDDVYFNNSLAYYRAKYPGKAVFIASSDDMSYVKSKLQRHTDVYFSKGTSAIFDMALLSACNHSVVTMGSYGFWSGFLAGGEVVYPDAKFGKEYRYSRQMYERIGLKSFTPLPVD